MTNGDLLDLIETNAKSYRTEALESIMRNGRRMYDLKVGDVRRIRRRPARYQRVVDAVLAGFINAVARSCGGDRGERVSHLKE